MERSLAPKIGLFMMLAAACFDSEGESMGTGTTGGGPSTGAVDTAAGTTEESSSGAPTTSGASGTSGTTGMDPSSTGAESTTGGPVEDPFDVPPQCSSRTYWELEQDEGSEQMNPGEACISCHTNEVEAPTFLFAGTVYPTAHEPDDCNSMPPATDAEVVITDAMNQVFVLDVNVAGNFFLAATEASFVPPFTAKVVIGADERKMYTPQTVGDCNSCHTQAGMNGAPGRILAP